MLAIGWGFTQSLASHKQTCNDDASDKHTDKRNSFMVLLQNNSLLFHLLEVPVSVTFQSGQLKDFMRWVIRVPWCPEHRTTLDKSNGNALEWEGLEKSSSMAVRAAWSPGQNTLLKYNSEKHSPTQEWPWMKSTEAADVHKSFCLLHNEYGSVERVYFQEEKCRDKGVMSNDLTKSVPSPVFMHILNFHARQSKWQQQR